MFLSYRKCYKIKISYKFLMDPKQYKELEKQWKKDLQILAEDKEYQKEQVMIAEENYD